MLRHFFELLTSSLMNILRVNGCRLFQCSRPGISSCSELTLMIQLKYGQSQVLCSVLEASLLEKSWWQDLLQCGFLLLDSSSHHSRPCVFFHSWQIHSSTLSTMLSSVTSSPVSLSTLPCASQPGSFAGVPGELILANIINYYKHRGDLYF